jgi:hypothetical protein
MSLTRVQLISRAIEVALVGLSTEQVPLSAQEGLIESLTLDAMKEFGVEIAGDMERFHLLQQTFAVSLTAGQGALPVKLIPQTLEAGMVSDADGNVLQKVDFLRDLTAQRSPLLGYYTVSQDKIYTRQIATGSLVDTTSPLIVVGGVVPDIDNLDVDVPLVIQPDLVEHVARKIRAAAFTPNA